MNHHFKNDYYRMTGKEWSFKSYFDLLVRYDLRYLKHIRAPKNKLHTLSALRASRKYGLEIFSTDIGDGLYLGHAHNINVHPQAVIGKNVNLNKGCTIGRENRGKRNGAPILGNDVWVGSNAMVVGAIHVGNDVLIAPNAYVNFDVPDHSVVIGNPAVIKHRENATEGYIEHRVGETEPIRVLYVINSFAWGGAEKLVYDLSIEIAKQVQFVGIAALYKQNNTTEADMINTLESHGVKTMILGKTAGKGRFKGIADIFKFAKKNEINIIHGHCSVPMLFGKIVGQMLHIPVICTIHNTVGYSAKKEKLTNWMAKAYISIGQAAEDYMVNDLKIHKKKTFRIYNAVKIDLFEKGQKNKLFWQTYGGRENQIALLNVARVTEQKNQICLLRALKRLIDKGQTNIRVYFLGYYDSKEQIAQQLNDYIQKNDLQDYVEFLGMHENVCDFLANADCFVMTSWYEGLSVAFLEAVISGTPIVTTDMPFVRELNDISACATVIPQDDDKALALALYEKAYQEQTQETIDRFKRNFSMIEFVQKHLEVYRDYCYVSKT